MNKVERTPEQEAEIARFQADVDAAEAALKAIRATLTASQWKEFIFLAHCEHEDRRAAEEEIWHGAINVLDNIAKGGRK